MKRTLTFPPRLRHQRVLAALVAGSCLAAPLVMTAASAAARTSPHRAATAARLELPWLSRDQILNKAMLERFAHRPEGIQGHDVRRLSAAPSVPVGNGPQATDLDQATGTLYVSNGNDNTVSLINAADCNSIVSLGCGQPVATVHIGASPAGLVVDQATDTVYVANSGDNTVSVIDGATCNAQKTSGCGLQPPTVAVGNGPVALAVDDSTGTLYVANIVGNTISVINAAACNATVTSGCTHAPTTVQVGTGPDAIAIDNGVGTVYIANGGDNTLSMINGSSCNAINTSGCNQTPPTVQVGGNPAALAVDRAVRTLYIANFNDGTLSLLSPADCNANVTSGCDQAYPTVMVGSGPVAVALNSANQTIYTANDNDSTVSAVSTARCNVVTTWGCSDQPTGALRTGGGPSDVTVDAETGTIYTPNYDDNTVSVLSATTCSAVITAGCTRFPLTVPVGSGPDGVAINDATHTVYVANSDDGTVSVVNGATCNATVTSGCGHSVATVTVGSKPEYLEVDQATDTIYVPNNADNTVSVIDGRTCNATVTSGCSLSPPTIAVPGPQQVAVDDATDTAYVGTVAGTVAVIDGITCNAETVSGCGQTPAEVHVSSYVGDVAVNQATNTVYVASPNDNIVSVIDGNACNSTVTTGCSQPPATVADADVPGALDVDQHTNTVYVANFTDNVSMINGAACDATVTSGCGQTPPTVSAGNLPFDVTVDQASDTVYVVNLLGDSVTVINGLTCNATITAGCNGSQRTVEVGGNPLAVDASSATHTAYVANAADSDVSVFGPRG